MKGLLDQILDGKPPDQRDVEYWDSYFPQLRRDVHRASIECDRDDPAAVARIELQSALYHIFFGDRPDKRPSPLQRYSSALFFIVHYLEQQKIPWPILREMLELENALRRIDGGLPHPIFEHDKKHHRPTDLVSVWNLRAQTAAALDYLMVFERMPQKSASFYIEKNFGVMASILAPSASKFGQVVIGWRRKLLEKRAPHASAQQIFDSRIELFSKLKQAGFQERAVADKVLVDTMVWATRVSDDALSKLYGEIERRSRLKVPY